MKQKVLVHAVKANSIEYDINKFKTIEKKRRITLTFELLKEIVEKDIQNIEGISIDIKKIVGVNDGMGKVNFYDSVLKNLQKFNNQEITFTYEFQNKESDLKEKIGELNKHVNDLSDSNEKIRFLNVKLIERLKNNTVINKENSKFVRDKVNSEEEAKELKTMLYKLQSRMEIMEKENKEIKSKMGIIEKEKEKERKEREEKKKKLAHYLIEAQVFLQNL